MKILIVLLFLMGNLSLKGQTTDYCFTESQVKRIAYVVDSLQVENNYCTKRVILLEKNLQEYKELISILERSSSLQDSILLYREKETELYIQKMNKKSRSSFIVNTFEYWAGVGSVILTLLLLK